MSHAFLSDARQGHLEAERPSISGAELLRATAGILRILWDGSRRAKDIVHLLRDECYLDAPLSTAECALHALEDGACVTVRIDGDERIYSITDAGSEFLAHLLETQNSNAPAVQQ